MKSKKITVAIICLVAMLSAALLINRKYKTPRYDYAKSIDFLSHNKLSLYASYNGFYHFDIDSREWTVIADGIYGHMPQEVAYYDNFVYFFDIDQSYIKKMNRTTQIVSDVLQTECIPNLITVSSGKLAYSCGRELFISYADTSIHKKMSANILAMDWHKDAESLFMSIGGEIIELSLTDMSKKRITEGLWVFHISAEHIVYCNEERTAIYNMDIVSGEKELICQPQEVPRGMDCTPNGKFIVLVTATNVGLFGHAVVPTIWDVENSVRYRLPPFKYHTALFFLD